MAPKCPTIFCFRTNWPTPQVQIQKKAFSFRGWHPEQGLCLWTPPGALPDLRYRFALLTHYVIPKLTSDLLVSTTQPVTRQKNRFGSWRYHTGKHPGIILAGQIFRSDGLRATTCTRGLGLQLLQSVNHIKMAVKIHVMTVMIAQRQSRRNAV